MAVGAAREAGRHGQLTLTDLAHRSRPAQVRLAAAIALGRIAPRMSDTILEDLAHTHGFREVRVQAALAGPTRTVLPNLAVIVGDHREREDIRYAAGAAAMKCDDNEGRRLLAELARSKVSRRMRNHITRLLQQ